MESGSPSSSSASSTSYPGAARISDSICFSQYTASLKCLETNQDKSKCQQQFDEYKECKKKEFSLAENQQTLSAVFSGLGGFPSAKAWGWDVNTSN